MEHVNASIPMDVVRDERRRKDRDKIDVEMYRNAVQTVVICSRMLSLYDIPKLLASIGYAETVGPILDPTLWIEKNEAMAEDKKLLTSAMPLWTIGKSLADAPE